MSEIVDPNMPLRLSEAVKIAFPRGGMTFSGRRREIARGRLTVEVMAGKQFTTLAYIEQMRAACRTVAKPTASPAPNERERSSTVAVEALELKLKALREKGDQNARARRRTGR